MGNKIIIVFLVILLADKTIAQDQHFSNFTGTLSYSNPSYIAVSNNTEFSSTYRNQWPGMNSAYVTYCASFVLPVDKMNSAFGLNLIHDNQAQGSIIKTSLNGIYSYTVKISKLIDITAGLCLSYNFRNINENRLVFESDITGTGPVAEPLHYQDYRSGYGDFSLGLTASYDRRFYSGISVNHLTEPYEHTGEYNFISLSRRYILHMGGIFTLATRKGNEEVFLLPGIMFQQQNHYQELLYGANCQISPFKFGLWARQDLRFNFDAIILITGFSWQLYNIYYSYDVNLKNLNYFSTGMGAHEVTFSINFEYNGKRKNRGAIKCPKI